ncbi:MAG TPA: hypothetical protein VK955_13990, partial [Xanthobacteraceae bacterium]|nr:hypothetical protein [Xanthobacteraceae bacterium]
MSRMVETPGLVATGVIGFLPDIGIFLGSVRPREFEGKRPARAKTAWLTHLSVAAAIAGKAGNEAIPYLHAGRCGRRSHQRCGRNHFVTVRRYRRIRQGGDDMRCR